MEINLTKIEVINVDGSLSTVDISKQFSDLVYKTASGVGVATLAMDLYKSGKAKINNVNEVNELIQVTGGLAYWIRKPLVDLLNGVKEQINSKENE